MWSGTTKREILESLWWLKIDSSGIKLNAEEPLARGGKADVLPGTYTRTIFEAEQRVAVKQLRYDVKTDKDKFSKSFVHEVDLLAGLSHPNIVKFIGFMEDLKNGKASMVFTWEDNGNVRDFLAFGDCEVPERISLIQDVMAGVEYLHTRKPPICHSDLKSLNILVNSSYRAVITDFGSARVLRKRRESDTDQEEDQVETGADVIPTVDECASSSQLQVSATGEQLTLTGPAWSLRWAAPEVLFGKRPDLPRDIWAVGWVIWEIITDKIPFHELNSEVYITMTVIQRKIPPIGQDAQMSQIVSLCSLMTECWAYNPKSRPSASKCRALVQWMPSAIPSPARETSSPSNFKYRSASPLLHMGYMQYLQNNYQAAYALYTEAMEKARFEKDKQVNAEGWNWLGEVCFAQGRYAQAGTMFTQARELHAHLGNGRGLVHALDGLGAVYRSESRLEDAKELYTEAEAICVRLGDEAARANVLNGMAAVLIAQGRYNQAIECYTRAHDIYVRIGNDLGQANSLHGLGEANLRRYMYFEALELFHKSLDLHGRVGNKKGQADALSALSKVYSVTGKHRQASEHHTQARDIYAQIRDAEGQKTTSRELEVTQKSSERQAR